MAHDPELSPTLIILIQACLHGPIAPDIEIATTFRDLVGHTMSQDVAMTLEDFPMLKMGVS